MRSAARPQASPSEPIVQAGKNCWRVERAHQFLCVQDAADYFALVRQALLSAQQTVFILGWDIFAGVDLLPDGQAGPKGPALRTDSEPKGSAPSTDAPTRLDELLSFIARRRPQLRCYVLIWDYAALYTLERDPWSRWRLGWRTHRHVHFGYDDRHPVGGSHHQKIVVVDDALAFCGGIDLTSHRWDTSAHRVDEPARKDPMGSPYTPYHEVQAMMSGPAATSFGVLARDRWRALGEEKKMPAVSASTADLWPSSVTADLTDVDVAIARTIPGSETQPAIRECEALFQDSIARAKRSIYIESQYFTNDVLGEALCARLKERNGPEIVVVAPTECEGWLERNTMGTFRASIFRKMIAADAHKRLRLVYPVASRTQNVPTFVHSKVMIADDELVRIGSANFSRRSMGVDTECDVAVDANGDSRVRAGIRHIRDRLIGEHLGLTPEDVERGVERAGSLRAFIDSRQLAEHTLVRIDLPPEEETTPNEAVRSVADPDEPMAFGSTVAELVPPADATNGLRPLPVPAVPATVVMVVLASMSSAVIWRSEFQTIQDMLAAIPRRPSMAWAGAAVIAVAGVAFIPLELAGIAAGALFGWLRGGLVALLGSVIAAAIGYIIGRAIGPGGLSRWMSRRSYRSGRQLGAHGVMGVFMLRLVSVATSGSIHLLCGAGRVPFATYMAGTLIAFIPAIAALAGLGTLLRQTLLDPTVANGLMTIGAAVLLAALVAVLRTFLLIRQFAPQVSNQRVRAEFG
jgi:phospholipase D1/2